MATHIEARQAVDYLKNTLPRPLTPRKVLVLGGGLAGLSTAKHLVDAGHIPIVLEARNLLGGKVAAWKDPDGDVSETGLHVFFGAYPNAMTLFQDLNISSRLQWKKHQLLFAKPRPFPESGVLVEAPPPANQRLVDDDDDRWATFDFPNIPAPFNAAVAILSNPDLLTWPEKIKLGIGLIPAYLFGQSYVEAQEGVTVQEWMQQRGIPDRVTDEIFLAMSKALGFLGPDRLSMQCVLIALNRFLQETNGSRLAFLDGSPTERLCEPLKQYIEARGGVVRTECPVTRILVNPHDKTVAGLLLQGNEVISADAYVNAMPVDALKKLLPSEWTSLPYFRSLIQLRGVPVINLHLWFDRKLKSSVDNLIFSRSKILSVYADMSEACREYSSSERSMLELVLAPAAPWMTKSDEDILQATLQELECLFPEEIRADQTASVAKVVKFTCVRTPTSVYETLPGTEAYRPTQQSPISNFYCAGDFSKQRYLASMEGAILSGKLAAKAFAEDELQRERDQSYKRPRQLTHRRKDPEAPDANLKTPDFTMYQARLASSIPKEVDDELNAVEEALPVI